MKTIAITARHSDSKQNNFSKRFEVPQSIVDELKENSVRLITIYDRKEAELALQIADGLILTGSSIDIHPYYYGQSEILPDDIIDEFRTDKRLIGWFKESRRPILGICGGLQAINVAYGGTLKQVSNHRDVEHIVNIIGDNTFLNKVYKCNNRDNLKVNSFHNYAVDEIGKGLNIVALASENTIEALESSNGLTFGVQWHPEEQRNCYFENLIKYFLGKC